MNGWLSSAVNDGVSVPVAVPDAWLRVLPHEPIRQWVLSFPFQLRFLFASRPELMDKALGIVHRAIASHLVTKAGKTQKTA